MLERRKMTIGKGLVKADLLTGLLKHGLEFLETRLILESGLEGLNFLTETLQFHSLTDRASFQLLGKQPGHSCQPESRTGLGEGG